MNGSDKNWEESIVKGCLWAIFLLACVGCVVTSLDEGNPIGIILVIICSYGMFRVSRI